MFQRIKTEEGKLYNLFYEANIIPISKYWKSSREKKIVTQPHIKIGEKILNKILADQIQWQVFLKIKNSSIIQSEKLLFSILH